jgi:hypothetical protein
MSKIKTPREKKLASLALDCRNVYGENDKASRKLIPRAKQQGHQALRRASKLPLQNISTQLGEDGLVQAEAEVKSREIQGKRKAFTKRPDAPLRTLLEYKETGDWQSLMRPRK